MPYDAPPPAHVGQKIIEILCLVESGLYGEAVQKCAKSRVLPDDLKRVIDEYGRTPVLPPADASERLNYIRIIDSKKYEYFVIAPFYTREEGLSDLNLQFNVTIYYDRVDVELRDFRAM